MILSFITAFCGLYALQLVVEKNTISCNSAICLAYILGCIVGMDYKRYKL